MTRRLKHASMVVVLFGVAAILSGCTNFDPDNFGDMFDFNKKEKLPGERRALFPEGVPGVTQGVPPHLMKGQQQQEAEAIAAAPAPEPEKPKAAAKPKPPRTASRPARVTVSPEQQPQPQQPPQAQPQQSGANAPSSSPWPSPTAQQPPPSASPWPSAPQSGTFQR